MHCFYTCLTYQYCAAITKTAECCIKYNRNYGVISMGANLSSSYETSNTVSQDEMSNLNASSLQARIEEIHRRTRLRRAPPPPPIRRSSLLTSNVENDDSKSEGNEQCNSSTGKFLQFFPPFVIFLFFCRPTWNTDYNTN